MIIFVPRKRSVGYSSTEIKNAVKDAYYEIQQEEAERERSKQIEADIERANDVFDRIVGEALINGEEIKF